MDFSKQMIRFPNSGRADSQRKSPRPDSQRMSPKTVVHVSHESNENFSTPNKTSTSVTLTSKNEPKNLKSPYTSPLSQKRILTEKNHHSNSFKKSSPPKKSDNPLPISTNGSRPDSPYPLPYDPVTNYTSPRPEFLRYDPNRRMEIMQRIEKAMFDDEDGLSPWTSNSSTSPQVSAEKAILEEEPSQPTSTNTAVPEVPSEPISTITTVPQQVPSESTSTITTTVPQVPVPECGEETCLIDDDEEEEVEEVISYAKLVLRLFFLACFLSSVCYIFTISSNVGMKLRGRTSEVSMLGEIIGLSNMCLSRRNAENTCGIEEWAVAVEEVIPKVFDITGFIVEEEDVFTGGDVIGFTTDEEEIFSDNDEIGATSEEEEMFGGGEIMDVRKETEEIEIGIGLLAQGNIVEYPAVDLHAVVDAPMLERSEALKIQVYLLYSMLALAATLSVLVPLIAYLHKHTSKRFYRKKKQIPTSETDALKGSGAVKKSTDNMSNPVAGNSKMHVIQTAEVDLLGESSLTDTTIVNGSSVKEVELRGAKISQKELELQATPRTPIPEASLEKFERSTNRRDSAKTEVTSLRRSSRLRSRITST